MYVRIHPLLMTLKQPLKSNTAQHKLKTTHMQ